MTPQMPKRLELRIQTWHIRSYHPNASQAPNGVLKRKRNNRRSSNDAGDNPHVQFIQAQKKQKLSNAKSNDSYFKTANKLEGGTPRIIKLPLANRKEFLQDLQDHGRARSNHRSLRGIR